jgi:hypothetical protein
VGYVKAHEKHEGLSGGLGLHEIHRAIADDVIHVPHAPVRHFLEIGVEVKDLVVVEHHLHSVDAFFEDHVLLAIERGGVPGLAQQGGKAGFHVRLSHRSLLARMVSAGGGGEPGEDVRAAGHADGSVDVSVLEAHPSAASWSIRGVLICG